MALYFIRSTLQTEIAYVLNSETKLETADIQTRLDAGEILKDLIQQTGQETVRDCMEITKEEYIKAFDQFYPAMKNMDKTSKFLQIQDVDDTILAPEMETGDDLL